MIGRDLLRSALLGALAARCGPCPCEGEEDEPGPHLATCPWSDPDYCDAPYVCPGCYAVGVEPCAS